MSHRLLPGIRAVFAAAASAAVAIAAPEPRFRPVDVDTNISVGYGVTTADVDGDGRRDIVLCDARQVAWYRNPTWSKQVIAENLTPQDHVCVAAEDIDGDGKAEIAVGAGWNPGDTTGSGALFLLQPGSDRSARWTPVRLPHLPTMHRIRWVREAGRGWTLWSVPLHGVGNKDGQGEGVRIQRYLPPRDSKDSWTVETVVQSWHKTHNFDPLPDKDGTVRRVLVGAAEGAFEVALDPGKPQATTRPLGGPENGGVGEVRRLSAADGTVAAISPMHGNQLVVFRPADGGISREVVDDSLIDGHALACGDLLGTGSSQVVAGWRAMGRPRSVKVGIALYVASEGRWRKHLVDDDMMACEDLCLADLDGDGRLDIVAAGRATKNVRIYFNETQR